MPRPYTARHRVPRSLHLGRRAAAVAAVGLGVALLPALPAQADVTRCVGAVGTPGAFACYTSPRFDQASLDQQSVGAVPVVCYGLGCTREQLELPLPSDTVGGRFIAVSYLGNSYTVFRPTADQPYVLTSSNRRLSPAVTLQVLALETALQAAQA